jgi:hypothetical protein
MKLSNPRTMNYATVLLATISMLLLALIGFGQSSQGPRNGSTTTNSAIAGSTSAWSNTGNALIFDAAFSNNASDLPVTDQYTDYLVVTNFGFSISPLASITGIQVRVTRFEDNSKVLDYRLRLVKAGTIGTVDRISGVVWPAVNTTRVYGTSSDLWGDTWTDADVNSAAFGVAIAVKRVAGGVAPINAQIDNIRITVYYNIALPVELVSFNASAVNNNVTLNWQTATEVNNNFFGIERSSDGLNYSTIGTVQGTGNSSVIQNYSFTDHAPGQTSSANTLYYRLSQTDFDGTRKDLGVRTVVLNNAENAFSVYPNPFTGAINVCLENISMPATISISNARGKSIYTETISAKNEGAEHTIHLPEKTEPGVYFVSLSSEDKKMVKRILK